MYEYIFSSYITDNTKFRLPRQLCQCCLGKYWLFSPRIIQNTQIYCVCVCVCRGGGRDILNVKSGDTYRNHCAKEIGTYSPTQGMNTWLIISLFAALCVILKSINLLSIISNAISHLSLGFFISIC